MATSLTEEYFGTEDLSNDEPLYDSGRTFPRKRKSTTRVTLKPIEKPTETFNRGFGVSVTSEDPISSDWIVSFYKDAFARLLADFGFVTVEKPLPITKLATQKVGQSQSLFHFDDGATYTSRRFYKMTLLAGSTDTHSRTREVPLWVVDSEEYKPKLGAVIEIAHSHKDVSEKCKTALKTARDLLDANPAALNKISDLAFIDDRRPDPELFKQFIDLETLAFSALDQGKYTHGYELSGLTTRHILTAASGLACAPKVGHGKLLPDPMRVPVEGLLFPIIPDKEIEGADALERWINEF